jgi:hypothetical protein
MPQMRHFSSWSASKGRCSAVQRSAQDCRLRQSLLRTVKMFDSWLASFMQVIVDE